MHFERFCSASRFCLHFSIGYFTSVPVYCSVVCLFAANISLDTHTTRAEDTKVMMDGDVTTCLTVIFSGNISVSLPKIVTELNVNVDTENVPDQLVIIEVNMADADCNGTIVFYKTAPFTSGCNNTKTDGIVGERLRPMKNVGGCFLALPLDCVDAANTGLCEFNGVLAVNGTVVGQGSVKMCEIKQG